MAVRMLIIDDEPEICDFLRDIALGIGYEVVTANRAEDFKRAFAAAGADVILLDLTLPGTDGIELLKYMAELGTRARILIVSGYDEGIRRMAHTIGLAKGLHMAGVLPKPLRVAELRNLLSQLMREAEPG
jgi:DNA-binding response OmpR family regulator